MNARYESLELSKKVIALSNSIGMHITNLQLQKILYYIQGSFMREFGVKAFNEPIECWTYGPVVKQVWNVFSSYGRGPIRGINSELVLREEEESLICSILREKLSMYVWDLVDATHQELPWKNANEHHKNELSDEDMRSFFCK